MEPETSSKQDGSEQSLTVWVAGDVAADDLGEGVVVGVTLGADNVDGCEVADAERPFDGWRLQRGRSSVRSVPTL